MRLRLGNNLSLYTLSPRCTTRPRLFSTVFPTFPYCTSITTDLLSPPGREENYQKIIVAVTFTFNNSVVERSLLRDFSTIVVNESFELLRHKKNAQKTLRWSPVPPITETSDNVHELNQPGGCTVVPKLSRLWLPICLLPPEPPSWLCTPPPPAVRCRTARSVTATVPSRNAYH